MGARERGRERGDAKTVATTYNMCLVNFCGLFSGFLVVEKNTGSNVIYVG